MNKKTLLVGGAIGLPIAACVSFMAGSGFLLYQIMTEKAIVAHNMDGSVDFKFHNISLHVHDKKDKMTYG